MSKDGFPKMISFTARQMILSLYLSNRIREMSQIEIMHKQTNNRTKYVSYCLTRTHGTTYLIIDCV